MVRDEEGTDHIRNWMRNRNTIEFIGLWETLNNQNFKHVEFDTFGLIVGGGLKYDISNLQFGLQADYYLDFTKVAEWRIESTGIDGEITVNTFAINFTIGYRLK